ncbi:MAG: sulfite exporter TauE/SafE family protein [candidate division Zixibacteria bacterium]|nr:sulfite exporter TauE/SafE family protein [candidate division Zixibacteria bacterium]MBU1471834.1 sulfite exporter TauE/SafE family protein [candidate division Zixibacteria bacterium]MBU2625716.1 sulfite exporter TauE/SafE family protein [candidate division Zixibacteria bacterium]
MEDLLIHITTGSAIQIIILGFIGGVLSGFIGSGGAFFMTPGMMNLGVQGIMAVGSNITHKFGKALVGSRKHGELGHVDKKLGIFMLITAVIGIRLAVWVSSALFGISDTHGEKGAAANLYISTVFVVILSGVAISMVLDVLRSRKESDTGPSKKISGFLSKLRLFPMIYFPVADVRVSLWALLLVGLFTGYLAGTIGVGGFVGVPAMIYVFGVPAAVAAGTELFLAMFMGAFGAINYAFLGFVDIRLVVLLYIGSLLGIFVGAYGTKVVNEVVIRLVTGIIILLCVISRVIAIPIYLAQLNMIGFVEPSQFPLLNDISKYFLYISGIGGVTVILIQVIRAYIRKRRVYATIVTRTE